MLHSESPHQGIYAPLSQAMTDSESDEEIEIHNSTKHRRNNFEQKQARRTPPSSLALNQFPQQRRPKDKTQFSNSNNQNQQPQVQTTSLDTDIRPTSYTTNMQNTFRSVMMSDIGLNGDLSSFNNDADNVAILGDQKETTPKLTMSPMRRLCFVGSLLLCVFALVSFIWFIPCDNKSTCPAPLDRIKTHNWLNNYTKVELKGGVHIVSGTRFWENNLIFLYRGDAFFDEMKPENIRRHGIISLIGSSGKVAWILEMMDEPIGIDCTLIDVDKNGRTDCLVLDIYGMIGILNPLIGKWYWVYGGRSSINLDITNFPLMLPDLDADGVLDILVTVSRPPEEIIRSSLKNGSLIIEHHNILRILSGRTGKPIGDSFRVHNCDSVRNLRLENRQIIEFTCIHNETELIRSKTLAELYALITNKSILGLKLTPASKIAQHPYKSQRRTPDYQKDTYSLSGRELVVENRGICPDCNVTLILSENRNGKLNILRNFTQNAMYGMVPTQWHFKSTKPKMSGFIMKFWKWNTNRRTIPNPYKQNNSQQFSNSAKPSGVKENSTKPTKEQNQSSKLNHNKHKRELQHDFPTIDFDSFEHLYDKKLYYTIDNKGIFKRSIGANSTRNLPRYNLIPSTDKMQMVTETVILILFIGADTRIENISQNSIVQFCRLIKGRENCQPDLKNQENSMLIADLDQDGSQELVSYMSTFFQTPNNNRDWNLVTNVRLLRLQSELPLFYDEDIQN